MANKQISGLLNKNMSRKEFIVVSAFGLAGVVGLSTLLRILGKENPWTISDSTAYGGGSYSSSHKP